MKLLLENWREYNSHQEEASLLVEQIWTGSLVRDIVLLEHQQAMLEEGIESFFSGAFDAVKGKIKDFTGWKDQKLMVFIDGAIKKIQDKILLKLFPKYGTRAITDAFGVFRRDEYLKAGAAVLSMVLQKLAELGAQAVLDAMSAGSATATMIAANIKKIKLFVKTIKSSIDPNGIVEILSNIEAFKGSADLLLNLKKDLQNPHREFLKKIKNNP